MTVMKGNITILKISGDLHLLLRLFDNWDTYKKKPDLFHEENLASLTVNTTRKIFTLAKFYSHPEHENLLEVLRKAIATRDGSRFSRSHLEFPEIRELLESGRVQVLKVYALQPVR
jgi:hypothetical protein